MSVNTTFRRQLTFSPALAICFVAAFALAGVRAEPAQAQPASAPWVAAYYLSDDNDSGRLPVSAIDFSALTTLIHFCIFPNADGTLVPNITPQQSQVVVTAAHKAGCKVLVSLGSPDKVSALRSAVSARYRGVLVRNLVQFAVSRGYDGIDLDYEPLEDQDIPDFTAFAFELREAMNRARPGMLLTAAVASEPGMFSVIQNDFDQINLMTYDLSGMYTNFKSWYNSNLYGDPSQTMEHGRPYPSCDAMVQKFIQAGVAPSKLGIGAAFYGYVWTGVSGPRQAIQGNKDVSVDDGADYRDIMDKWYDPAHLHWDNVAKAPYLGFDAPQPQDRKFVSYDDATLSRMKVAYARKEGLGGVMIWELGAGYRPDQPEGRRNPLLDAIKEARQDASLNDPADIPPPAPQ